MKEYATRLYNSSAWQKCRAAYMEKVGYLCEDCLARGVYTKAEIVHHIIPIDETNADDPSITLNFDNLRAVCRYCHAAEHGAKKRRYITDEMGRIIPID